MNCQDIARILDERDIDGLSAGEWSRVQTYLDSCQDCARDWQVHARLRDQLVPAVPAELRASFASVTGSGAPDVRRRGRFIAIGALAAVAAAAAMVSVQMNRSPSDAEVTLVQSGVDAEAVAEDLPVAESATNLPPAVTEPESPSAPAKQPTGVPDSSALHVLLLPVRHESEDEAARQPTDAFHHSLYLALRNQPDVSVELADEQASGRSSHRITVISPNGATDGTRRMVGMSAGGRSGAQFSGPGAAWAVEVTLDAVGRTNPGHTASVDQFLDEHGVPTGGSCNASLSVDRPDTSLDVGPVHPNAMPEMCTSAEGLAAWLVAALRPQPAPPPDDVAMVVAQLAGSSNPHGAFREILRRSRQDGLAFDVAAIDAVMAYLRGLTPDQRAVGLIQMRSLRQPGLLAPLLELLRQDEDEKVRLEVISTLVASFPGDARVRAAFESVATRDRSRMVQMAASRTLDEDKSWREYALATLSDSSLAPEDRLAPVLYDAQYPGGLAKLPAYLGSERGTRLLSDLFYELRAAASLPQPEMPADVPAALAARMAEMGGGVVGWSVGSASGRAEPQVSVPGGSQQQLNQVLMLLNLANPAVAVDLHISILRESPRPPQPLLVTALQGLATHRDDLRASAMLDDIAAGRAGQDLRDLFGRLQL